jgi:hypothetical protein
LCEPLLHLVRLGFCASEVVAVLFPLFPVSTMPLRRSAYKLQSELVILFFCSLHSLLSLKRMLYGCTTTVRVMTPWINGKEFPSTDQGHTHVHRLPRALWRPLSTG